MKNGYHLNIMDEYFQKDPLYQQLKNYFINLKQYSLKVKALRRKLLMKNSFRLSLAISGLIIGVGILLAVYASYQKSFQKPLPNQPVLKSTPEAKIVCKQFNDLEEALKNIQISCIVKLKGQGLTKVPQDITKLTNLDELSLKDNSISEIPAQLFQLTNLLSLDLSNNRIRQIPSEIANLKGLQILNLEGNNINEAERLKIQKLVPAVTKISF